MMDPIVIDPPDFDQHAAWKECHDAVEKCGGIQDADGEVNWRAAFSADPGVCSCPACGESYWCWGRRQRCRKCGFEYPTDAWPMYADGVYAARFGNREGNTARAARHKERMGHPYYRYGFEHPVDTDLYDTFHALPWRKIMDNKTENEHGDT